MHSTNKNYYNKIKGVNNYCSLISLNINVNSPIKRHRLTGSMQKQDPSFCCIQEIHLSIKNRHYLRVKSWETISKIYVPEKQTGVAILISNKIDFKSKLIRRDGKDTSYSSKEKSTKVMFQFSTSMPQTFVKEMLLKIISNINPHTLTVGDFNAPLSSMDSSSRQKLEK